MGLKPGGGTQPMPPALPPGGGNVAPPPGAPGGRGGPGGFGPSGPGGLGIGDYYLLKTQIPTQKGSAIAAIIVRFADEDGKPVAPANHTNVKIEGVVESMEGTTITIKDAKIIK